MALSFFDNLRIKHMCDKIKYYSLAFLKTLTPVIIPVVIRNIHRQQIGAETRDLIDR